MGFYVPRCHFAADGDIVALFTIKDRPGTLGLPNVGRRNDSTNCLCHTAHQPELPADFCEIYIPTNPLVWIIIIGDMSVPILRAPSLTTGLRRFTIRRFTAGFR
ncbi:hypothetical protein KCP73_21930 [Salmonella enterica subsp. enterica]|nr:hypothetical protein KCP73_21930 [Salmonella enterica subsp. enterica]